MLKDTSPFPYGKHKDVAMVNVPDDYLLYVYNNHDLGKYPELKLYLKKNIEVIKTNVERNKKR